MMSTLIMIPLAETSQELFVRHPSVPRPAYGGTLVWGTSNPPTIINPILTQSSVSSPLMALIFDSLVHIDGHGRVVPGLAERWDISDDIREYVFHLRHGVKFHDGHEFTAEDVKFTYDAIQDPRNDSPWRTNTEMIDRWEVIDKYTIKAVLSKPTVGLLRKLVREIAPRHLLQGKNLKSSAFNYHPVGTGAFRFRKWHPGSNLIELEANPDYIEGRPYLDRIVVKVYPDSARLWSAFMRQEVNVLKYISRNDYLILKDDPTFRTYQIPSGTYYALVYNLNDPLMSDLTLRRTISSALNQKAIMKASQEEGVESVGPFHPQSFGFNADIKPIKYDPSGAKQLLKRKGWKEAHGIRKKSSEELVLNIMIDSRREVDRKIAMIVRQELAEIGIKIEITNYNGESDLGENPFKKYKAQVWLRSLTGIDNGDSYNVALSWYSSSSESARFGGYHNRSVDELFEQARTIRDERTRAGIYKQIHRMVYDDQPACFLFFPMTYHAVSADLANTDGYFTVYMPTYTMKDWYINQKGGERHGNH